MGYELQMNDNLMTFQNRSAKVGGLANIHKSFLKYYDLLILLLFTTYYAHSHAVFVSAFPARSPRIRHRIELTEKAWENA